MPRRPRLVFSGVPHHITHRGNRRGTIFFTDDDRDTYLEWLAEYCARFEVQILAYCLMTNHLHLVAVPPTEDAFEEVFRPLHTRYSQRINRLRGWSGHVLQGRFFSSALDESYLWAAIRYVERNPVRAGIIERAPAYRWSSAAAHCGLRADTLLTSDSFWASYLAAVADWSTWLVEEDEPKRVDVLRLCAAQSVPCGAPEFVSALEKSSGRPLQARSRGRPRKEQDC